MPGENFLKERSTADKHSILVAALTTISLVLGITAVFCIALFLLGFFIMTNYRQSPWFWPIAQLSILFPLREVLSIFFGASLIFGIAAVVAAWVKHARKVLPIAALALVFIEIGAIWVTSSLFAVQSPLYSAYLGFTSSAKNQNRNYNYNYHVSTYETATPLMQAAQAGRAEEVKALLQQGMDPFEERMGGWTACGLAVKNGHVDTVKAFIEDERVANDMGYLGGLLKLAAIHDRLGIATLLIDAEAEIDKKTPDGWTPLMFAAYYGRKEIAEMLIAKGADIHSRNKYGWTILMEAVYQDRLEITSSLLGEGADVNAKNVYGTTALMLASEAGNIELVKLLLGEGAELNTKDNKAQTAMKLAGYNGHMDVVRLLQQSGAKE